MWCYATILVGGRTLVGNGDDDDNDDDRNSSNIHIHMYDVSSIYSTWV